MDFSSVLLTGKDSLSRNQFCWKAQACLCLYDAGGQVGEPDPEPEARRVAKVQVLFGL